MTITIPDQDMALIRNLAFKCTKAETLKKTPNYSRRFPSTTNKVTWGSLGIHKAI